MEENFYLQNCSDDDILALAPHSIYKFGLVRNAVKNALINDNEIPKSLHTEFYRKGVNLNITFFKNMLDGGVNCEFLKLGSKGWQKGKFKIKVTLEFCPDEPEIEETLASNEPETSEPESPLDEIRRMMKEDDT